MGYGPGQRLSSQQYHAIPQGWEVQAVLASHGRLGGIFDISPRQVRHDAAPWFFYRQVLLNIAEGVRAGDDACVELAVRYIEEQVMVSYSGYTRSLFARRLRKAKLSEAQQQRLARHFSALLESGTRCHEFSDFLRLWKVFITDKELPRLHALASSLDPSQANLAAYALGKLAPQAPSRSPAARAETDRNGGPS